MPPITTTTAIHILTKWIDRGTHPLLVLQCMPDVIITPSYINFCGFSVAVTSIRPVGFVAIWFYVHSTSRQLQTGGVRDRMGDPWVRAEVFSGLRPDLVEMKL